MKGEYWYAFDKAELYAALNGVDSDTQEEMLENLLDLLLTAQKEEKPVEKIIGPDLEQFCHSYFSEYNWRSRLSVMPKRLYSLLCGVFILQLIEAVFSSAVFLSRFRKSPCGLFYFGQKN